MGFAIYEMDEAMGRPPRMKRLAPVKLGGGAGVVAARVAGLEAESDGAFRIGPDELVAAVAGAPAGSWAVFETDDDGAGRLLQRVHAVTGVASDRDTDLLVTLEPLDASGSAGDGWIEVEPSGRLTSEALRCLGGTSATARHSWKWAEPRMQLGATVLGGATRTVSALLAFLLMQGAVAADQLLVAAAANLSPVLPALESAFEEAHPGCDVEFATGSTGKLAAQILQGAPFAVFLAADDEAPRRIGEAGRTHGAPIPYALGMLVFAFAKPLADGKSPLGADWKKIDRVVVADPEMAPYGRAAMSALDHLRRAGVPTPETILAPNIGQALQFLVSGAAKAGFIAASQSGALPKESWHFHPVPHEFHDSIVQSAALLAPPDGSDPPPCASSFIEFLRSKPVRNALSHAGYGLPEEGEASRSETH